MRLRLRMLKVDSINKLRENIFRRVQVAICPRHTRALTHTPS